MEIAYTEIAYTPLISFNHSFQFNTSDVTKILIDPAMADNGNPGNFANRPKEEVQNIASKGGQASHNGGFASMDADKQVYGRPVTECHSRALTISQREIASQGGKASSGSFEPGSEKAREAGRKGGQAS